MTVESDEVLIRRLSIVLILVAVICGVGFTGWLHGWFGR